MTGQGDSLNLGQGRSELCMPVSAGESMIAGQPTRTRTDSPVTVRAVELVDAKGIELVAAFSAPFVDGVGIGSMRLSDPGPAWALRQPARGTTVKDEYVNLLLEVRRVGNATGSAKSVQVTYETGDGKTLVQRSTTEIVLKDACH